MTGSQSSHPNSNVLFHINSISCFAAKSQSWSDCSMGSTPGLFSVILLFEVMKHFQTTLLLRNPLPSERCITLPDFGLPPGVTWREVAS